MSDIVKYKRWIAEVLHDQLVNVLPEWAGLVHALHPNTQEAETERLVVSLRSA